MTHLTSPHSLLLPVLDQLLHGQSDVLGDSSQKDRRDVTASVERDCRPSSIRMSELFVPPFLPGLEEPHCFEDVNDFRGLENGDVAHG